MQKCSGIGFTDSDLKAAGDGLRGAGCLCVCNHVGELPKHIPRLFPKQGNLLQFQLQTRMTASNQYKINNSMKTKKDIAVVK